MTGVNGLDAKKKKSSQMYAIKIILIMLSTYTNLHILGFKTVSDGDVLLRFRRQWLIFSQLFLK